MQYWWRKAGALSLRKRKYINDTKLMLFNMELLCFMKLEDARNYYKLILDKILKITNLIILLNILKNNGFQNLNLIQLNMILVYGAIMVNLISEKQKSN